jgi:predicted Zn-dependent protease
MSSGATSSETTSSSATQHRLAELLRTLHGHGLEVAEVYAKRGRSRRIEVRPQGEDVGFSEEAGWAVRAGNDRASFFVAASGEPRADFPWPEPDGLGLRLPDPVPDPARWSDPASFDAPLVGEREGLELLRSIARELAEELPGARLLHGRLEDGASESWLASSRGVRCERRARVAALRLEAAWQGKGPLADRSTVVTYFGAEREARALRPRQLARRLASRLTVAGTGAIPERQQAPVLLAPEVATRALQALLPLLCGPHAADRARALAGPDERFAAPALTILDDGRLPGGVFEAGVDGEGMPTRRVVLVEDGHFRHPLISHGEAEPGGPQPVGCAGRASWRDLPRPGPTHLFIEPSKSQSVAGLLAGLDNGFYLIDSDGTATFDLEADRFHLAVCGFEVRLGRAHAPIAAAWLQGSVSALLHGVRAVARDLTFLPLDGMIGSPTLLVDGLEIVGGE